MDLPEPSPASVPWFDTRFSKPGGGRRPGEPLPAPSCWSVIFLPATVSQMLNRLQEPMLSEQVIEGREATRTKCEWIECQCPSNKCWCPCCQTFASPRTQRVLASHSATPVALSAALMVVSHAEPSAETKWTRAAGGSNVQRGQDDNEDRLTSCRYFFLIKL
jgi:hypothetical protein